MDWQDISTAPKDGTEILLWAEEFAHPYFGQWDEDVWIVADICPEPWTELCIEPTHWMSLPAPPNTD